MCDNGQGKREDRRDQEDHPELHHARGKQSDRSVSQRFVYRLRRRGRREPQPRQRPDGRAEGRHCLSAKLRREDENELG
jgi:hypothetical protein